MSCEDLVSIGEMPPWQVRQGCACSYLIRGVAHTNNYRAPRTVPPDLMAFWALLGDPNNSTPKGTGGARCTAGFKSDLCPLWVQKQTSRRHLANVRFTSQSGHARVASRSPAQKVYILHKKLSLSGALCAKPVQG